MTILNQFSTLDTDIAIGRARVLAALEARSAELGLSGLFPPDAQDTSTTHLEIPGSVLASLAPVDYRSALVQDIMIMDTTDGIAALPGATLDDPATPTSYVFNMLARARYNPALDAVMAGTLTQPWLQAPDSSRPATAEELAVDPDRPPLVWKEHMEVRYHSPATIRYPKLVFS